MAVSRLRPFCVSMANLLVLVAITLAPAATGKDGNATKQSGKGATIRTLQFPSGLSLGRILVGNERAIFGDYHVFQQVSGASGTVKINVPAGTRVLFEANRRIFEDPTLLNKISPVGIDALKLNLISLDDREDDMCDRALGYVRHFTGVTEVNVDRSDATDIGVAKLKDVPSLIGISCFLSAINGACFKDLAALPALKALWVADCNIKQDNMRYLAQFPALEELELDRTHLDEIGSKGLAACRNLQTLSLRGNPRFSDTALKQLSGLPDLSSLDLRSTPVTLAGFKNLKLPRLKFLILPQSMQKDLAAMKALFPKVAIAIGAERGTLTKENSTLYAPLH
ncbi:MAG: hypothetical protein KGS72_22760 [Cyanobacteria bacterium REEB67]|nr:hypothetical protein [Cyanobacteria bacterium REEB67]